MKRILALIPLAVALVCAPAEAAVADPVVALKKQFEPGQGVMFRETTRVHFDDTYALGGETEGKIELDAKGVVAAESARTPTFSPELLEKTKDLTDPEELETELERVYTISIDGRLYVNGGTATKGLPATKLWAPSPGLPGDAAFQDQAVNVFEPATLKKLITTGKRTGAEYRGSLTLKALSKVSPTVRWRFPGAADDGVRVHWRLWLDDRGLVKRLLTTWTVRTNDDMLMTKRTDSRYFDWGTAVHVTPPPAENVATWKEIQDAA
ncbi:hypothetical protein HII36_14925 [Nonomuraea sp. NN258]|uniref:hypothetical protein n=1 Tax=Nonomuraea antri TaxID=2730852 RepID=UPI001568C3B2|nr:hypothetical protein [Nonomuraea antri]NRQ33126.1 hypothetical protein [Nonomuraea antri]